jgi:hypothetical protein
MDAIRGSVAYSDSQDAMNRASFVSRPSTQQPQMGQINMMNQQVIARYLKESMDVDRES